MIHKSTSRQNIENYMFNLRKDKYNEYIYSNVKENRKKRFC